MFRIAIPYRNRDKSSIIVAYLEEPYGPGSDPVVSIGCTLKDDVDNPTWKVHIPVDLVDEVVAAMKEASSSEWRNHEEAYRLS